jgi:hypothetical protein
MGTQHIISKYYTVTVTLKLFQSVFDKCIVFVQKFLFPLIGARPIILSPAPELLSAPDS